MGRPPRAGVAAGPVTIRATPKERSTWKKAAGKQPLSNWIRDVCNAATRSTLDVETLGPDCTVVRLGRQKELGRSQGNRKVPARGLRSDGQKSRRGVQPSKRREQICKFCGISLKGVSPIEPFSPIYDRLCPVRDYDPCERTTA